MSGQCAKINFHLRILFSCVTVWLYAYGIIILAIEATNLAIFVSLMFGPILSFYLINFFALPPSDDSLVQEILGAEFGPEEDNVSKIVDKIVKDESLCDSAEGQLTIKVIAHRFAGLDAPENTIPALDLCYQRGCVAVEFDVALTSDKVPIVFHDTNLDRMANKSDEVSSLTWDQLKTIDVSINHPFQERFTGTNIAPLEDVLSKCMEYDMRMVMDIKDSSQNMIDIVLETFSKHPQLHKRCIVTSFNPFVIYNIRSKNPQVVGAMSWRPKYMSHMKYSLKDEDCVPYYMTFPAHQLSRIADVVSTWFFNNMAAYFLGLSAVFLHKNSITPIVINSWKNRNVRVIAWTVNIPTEKLHFSRNLGVQYLTDTMVANH